MGGGGGGGGGAYLFHIFCKVGKIPSGYLCSFMYVHTGGSCIKEAVAQCLCT